MLTLVSAALLVTIGTGPEPVSGLARAGDGDSLTIGDVRVRLFGIDAPELSQTCQRAGQSWACGRAAANHLSNLVRGREVKCLPTGFDVHGRVVARCSAGGIDLNRTMVATGYAVAFRRYSMDYVSAEQSARLGKKGVWAGTFEMPSDVRAEQGVGRQARSSTTPRRRAPQTAFSVASACNIKGNHSRRGEFIYHLPGMPYYGETRAEAMFCSEAEAKAAGYRKARVR